MSNCCSSHQTTTEPPLRHRCPVNGKQYREVPYRTLLHHVKNPWEMTLAAQRYYFCDDPDCDVVYFGIDDTCITRSMLRTQIGIKEQTDDSLICYCFGINRAQARSNQDLKAYVIEKTRNGTCSCESCNPSGRCCLKDFPQVDNEKNR